MNYFIITGASRGFGRALALKLLEATNNFVITISRKNPDLQFVNTYHLYFDLSEVSGISSLMDEVFSLINSNINSVYLINNAGTAAPIGPLHQCYSTEIIKNFNINALSPTLMSAEMVRRLKGSKCEKGIINISSGAAKKPYHGWSCYCSSKASLEMLTQCIALENPEILIQTYDPGALNTSMQDYIRSQSKENFAMVEKFQDFKKNNRLITCEVAAEKFVAQYFSEC